MNEDQMTAAEHRDAGHLWVSPSTNPSDIDYSPFAEGHWETQEQRAIRTLRNNVAVLMGVLVVAIVCFAVYVANH